MLESGSKIQQLYLLYNRQGDNEGQNIRAACGNPIWTECVRISFHSETAIFIIFNLLEEQIVQVHNKYALRVKVWVKIYL